MRIPADAIAGDATQRHLDERHAALDQSAGQQAALTEQITTIGIADGGLFFLKVEGPSGIAAHEPDSPIIGQLVAPGSDSGTLGCEVAVEVLQQSEACLQVLGHDVVGSAEVADLEGGFVVARSRLVELLLANVVGDHQRSVLRSEKARTE